jgi:hypothetical protein
MSEIRRTDSVSSISPLGQEEPFEVWQMAKKVDIPVHV